MNTFLSEVCSFTQGRIEYCCSCRISRDALIPNAGMRKLNQDAFNIQAKCVCQRLHSHCKNNFLQSENYPSICQL